MLTFSGYRVEARLLRGAKTTLLRATRTADGRPVLLRTQTEGQMPAALALSVRREEAMLRRLRSPHIVRCQGLTDSDEQLALVLEDFGAEPLSSILTSRSLTPLESVAIAHGVAQGLGALHEAGLIHCALNPSTIAVNPDSGETRIADLSTARPVSGGDQETAGHPYTLYEMMYIAPEQTGRGTAAAALSTPDPRSDLYALGCVLYELLTGARPFEASSARQIVHSHVARTPVAPIDLVKDLPTDVSLVVMKLLQKLPADRYQSASGLEHDLDLCQRQLRENRPPDPDFTPGSHDGGDRFDVSAKLFGREAEMGMLLEAYARSQTQGGTLALVSGGSGIGKTALVQSMRWHPQLAGARFLMAKFDLTQVSKPYSALVTVFERLVEELVASTDARGTDWRQRLRDTFGEHLGVLSQFIPEMRHLTNAAPPPDTLTSEAAAFRLRYNLKRLLRSVASPGSPLVLFLDDLQWADTDSLALIRDIAWSGDIPNMLMICTFRPQPAHAHGSLANWLSELKAAEIATVHLEIRPLGAPDVEALLTESLIRSNTSQTEFARRIAETCDGNPFFIHHYLADLHRYGMITEAASGETGWICAESALDKTHRRTDSDALLRSQIERLPDETQTALHQAACLGTEITLAQLAQATGLTIAQLTERLVPSRDCGLVTLTGETGGNGSHPDPTVAFIHDRVQQVAFDLVPACERPKVHLELGRRLIGETGPPDQWMFSAIGQVNLAADLIEDRNERLHCARLNLDAALRARSATAFADARIYLNHAETHFPGVETRSDRHFCARLSYYRAEAESLAGEVDAARQLTLRSLQLADDPLLRGDAFDLLIVQHTLAGEYEDALSVGRKALAEFGLEIPEDPRAAEADEMERARSVVQRTESWATDRLGQADARTTAVLRIMINLLPPTDFAAPELNSWLAARGVTLSSENGYAPESAKMLANFANVLALGGEYELANHVAEHALRLAHELGGGRILPRVLYTVSCYIHHWTHPMSESRRLGEQAFRACQRAGEVQYAGYVLAFHRVINELFMADDLDATATRLAEFDRFVCHTRNTIARDLIKAAELPIAPLRSAQHTQTEFERATADGEALVARAHSTGNRKAVCLYRVLEGFAWLARGDADRGLASAVAAADDLGFVSSTLLSAMQPLLQALATTARHRGGWSELEPPEQMQVKETTARFDRLATLCPANFEAARELLRAEICRLQGQPIEAAAHYDGAIASGHGFGFPPLDALACDLSAKCWGQQGAAFIANAYRSDARERYARWGATAIASLLAEDSDHPNAKPPDSRSLEMRMPTLPELSNSLDREAMIQGALAVAGKIRIQDILESLMQLLMECGGAERGALLAEREDGLHVEARGRVVGRQLSVQVHSERIHPGCALPHRVIDTVRRTLEPLLLADATGDPSFARDPYIRQHQSCSMLCVPIVRQQSLVGIAYLENTLTNNAFSPEQIGLVEFLASQAAMSIDNANLVQTLEKKVAQRTADLERLRHEADRERIAALKASSAKSALLANVSHELRTPLNAIIGFSDTLNLLYGGELEGAQSEYIESRQAEYVQDIYESGQHLLALITEMLDLSKIEAGRIDLDIQEHPVEELTCSSLTIIRGRARDSGVHLQQVLSNDTPTFLGDARRIKQVLVNLLSNGVKFTPRGGEVTLRVGISGHALRIDVEDTGIGISPEDREHIFEPFFRVTRPGMTEVPGTGLGLALSKQLIELHGGSLTVRGREGGGSVFTALLPQADRGLDMC